jgi:hypothetical protein
MKNLEWCGAFQESAQTLASLKTTQSGEFHLAYPQMMVYPLDFLGLDAWG